MGLISKTVMVKWYAATKKHYENKGYIYTKIGEEFEIKVEDLMDNSWTEVVVVCDNKNCKNPNTKMIKWMVYKMSVREDGKYYCQKCGVKLFAGNTRVKTQLKNGKSFEQWCAEYNKQNILEMWDCNLNKEKPSEICYSANKKYYFKCLRGLHKSELKNINSFTAGKNGSMDCNYCNSFAQWGIDNICKDFLDKYWDYDKNTLNPWEINKCANKLKVWIKCQEKDYHDSYDIPCNDFYNNHRCPYCKNMKVHPLDSLGKLLEDKNLLHVWSDKNKKSPYLIAPHSMHKAWFKCGNKKHEDYFKNIGNASHSNFRCPECVQERDESFLQEKVRLYLESLNEEKYTILHEHKCTIVPQNPKSKKGHLPFDNEIKELKLIIEIHGQQHYKINKLVKLVAKYHNTTPEYELHYQKLRDRYKKFISYTKGYNYLEIPYWTDDKKETWKKLIDNKISEILSKEITPITPTTSNLQDCVNL